MLVSRLARPRQHRQRGVGQHRQRAAEAQTNLTPTAPDVAFPKNDLSGDPIAMYQQDIFTVPASLAGLPAMSLPCGFSNGLPLGLQVIGKALDEESCFKVAAAIEDAAGFKARPEKWW